MSSRGRDYDRSGTQRSRSRAGAFLDALEGGHVREALNTLKPSSQAPSDHHYHHHRHHSSRAHEYYDERPSRRSRYDEAYYYAPQHREYDAPRPRRHRSAHSDRPDHHSSHHRRSSSSHGPSFRQAAGAAVTAGLVEAWRSRHDADRTVRVATAALGAAATDTALAANAGQHDHKEKRHIVESALAGLVENRLINGPRR